MKKVSPLCIFIMLFALLVQSSGISAQCTSITFQTGSTQATGARIANYNAATNFDFTNYPAVGTGQWTTGGTLASGMPVFLNFTLR